MLTSQDREVLTGQGDAKGTVIFSDVHPHLADLYGVYHVHIRVMTSDAVVAALRAELALHDGAS